MVLSPEILFEGKFWVLLVLLHYIKKCWAKTNQVAFEAIGWLKKNKQTLKLGLGIAQKYVLGAEEKAYR